MRYLSIFCKADVSENHRLDNQSEVSDYDGMKNQPDLELIAHIEAFLAIADMRPTTFGRLAAKDQNLIAQLKDGRELRRKTRERVLSFIGSHSIEAPDVSCLNSIDTRSETIAQGKTFRTLNAGGDA